MSGVGCPSGGAPRGSIRARLKAYEESCRQSDSKVSLLLGFQAPSCRTSQVSTPSGSQVSTPSGWQAPPSRVTRTSSSTSLPSFPSRSQWSGLTPAAARRPQRRLAEVAEQRVMKAGLARLYRELVARPNAQVELMPRRADGSHRVMSAAFLKRLVSGELELKVCLESDVSSAQYDLKHLSLEQLLALRFHNLGFACESDNHSAHRNFLRSVDGLVSEKLGKRSLRGGGADSFKVGCLQALGSRVTTVLGVVELLEQGWDAPAGGGPPAQPPQLPPCWALDLADCGLAGCRCGLLHSEEIWLELLTAARPDFTGPACGHHVAVAADRSVLVGRERRLQCDILILDPQVDDIMTELFREEARAAHRSKHSLELSTAIAKKCSGRAATLGLEPSPAFSPDKVSEGQDSTAFSRSNREFLNDLLPLPRAHSGADSELSTVVPPSISSMSSVDEFPAQLS